MSVETLIVLFVALGLGGFVKGAMGLGLPVVSVPALAAFIGVPHALAVVAVPVVVTNAWQAWRLRAHWRELKFLNGLLAGGFVGVIAGTWLLVALPASFLSLILGLLIVCYIALQFARPAFKIGLGQSVRWAPAIGVAGGVLQGSTGISAPVTVTFFHSLRLERGPFVFGVSALFLLFGLVHAPALAVAGVMTWPRFLEGLLVLLPILVMLKVGELAAQRLSRAAFDRAILVLLAVIAVKLIYDGIAA